MKMEEVVINDKSPDKVEEYCKRFNECEDKDNFKFNPDAPEYCRRLNGYEDRFKFNPDAPEYCRSLNGCEDTEDRFKFNPDAPEYCQRSQLNECDDEFRFNPDAAEFISSSSDNLSPPDHRIEYIKCSGEPDPTEEISLETSKTNPPDWSGSGDGDGTARIKSFGGNVSTNLWNPEAFVSQPPPNFKSPWMAGSGYRIFTHQNTVNLESEFKTGPEQPEDIVGNENDAPLLIAPFANQVPLSEFQPVYQLIGYAEPPIPAAPASVQVPSSNVQVLPDNYSEVNMGLPVTQHNYRMQTPQQIFCRTPPLWQPNYVPRHQDPSYEHRRNLQPFPPPLVRSPTPQQQRMPNFPIRLGPPEQQRFSHIPQPRLPQPPRLSIAPNPITATGESSPFVTVIIPNVEVCENGNTRRIPSLIPAIFPSTSRGRRRY